MSPMQTFQARLARSVFGPGFGSGRPAGSVGEVTVAGLSTDPGQVLGTGLDGGVLLVGADIVGALDGTLGGLDWRQPLSEQVLSWDAATRQIALTAGTPAVISLASQTLPGLMAPADKAKLDGLGPGGGGGGVETTAADLATRAIDAGIDTIRTTGHGAPGDGGHALYARRGAEPGHPGKLQSGDGAWWEIVPEAGALNVLQFGAVRSADGAAPVADSLGAFVDCIAASAALGRPQVQVPGGGYRLSTTLELREAIELRGIGATGQAQDNPAQLWLPDDTTGILIHRAGTAIGGVESPDDPATGGADHAIVEGLTLRGNSSTGVPTTLPEPVAPHGFHLRARAKLISCGARGFAGCGFAVIATMNAGDPEFEGNANNWVLENCWARDNGLDGLYVDGADVNAGFSLGLDATNNGRWGIQDSSFLGNHHLVAHAAGNGMPTHGFRPATRHSKVSVGTALFFAHPEASPAALAATAPGTDPTVWVASRTGVPSVWPEWQSGGDYAPGGAYYCVNPNSRSTFQGCYSEPDQSDSFTDVRVAVVGGLQGAGLLSRGAAIIDGSYVGPMRVADHPDDTLDLALELRPGGNSFLNFGGENSASEWRWRWDAAAGGRTRVSNRGLSEPVWWLDRSSTVTYGRPSPQGGAWQLRKAALGAVEASARFLTYDTGAGATEEHGVGDLVLNSAGADLRGQPIGWSWATQHDGAASGTAVALWLVPTLDSALTLPQIAGSALPAPGPHAGTLVFDAEAGGLRVSDGAAWQRVAHATLTVATPGADHVLTPQDAGGVLRMDVAAANTVTVNAGVLTVGQHVTVTQAGVGRTTLVPGAGVTINPAASLSIAAQHGYATLLCVGTDTYDWFGNVGA